MNSENAFGLHFQETRTLKSTNGTINFATQKYKCGTQLVGVTHSRALMQNPAFQFAKIKTKKTKYTACTHVVGSRYIKA